MIAPQFFHAAVAVNCRMYNLAELIALFSVLIAGVVCCVVVSTCEFAFE